MMKSKSSRSPGEDPEATGPPGKSRSPRYSDLFKYARRYDKWLMLFGTLGAAGEGLGPPIIGLVMNKLVNSFGGLQANPSQMSKEVSKCATYLVYIAIASSIASYIEVSCWIRTGERQSALIKAKYLRAILRQNVGFFDGKGTTTGEVVSNVAKDSELIQDAMSEKVGNFLANLIQFLAAYGVGFYLCWQLSFLAMALIPLVMVPGLRYKKALTEFGAKVTVAYDRADLIVEESVSSVRTVYSFAVEKRTVKDFVEVLAATMKLGCHQGIVKGLAVASTGMAYVLWAAVAWLGHSLVQKGTITGSQVVITGFVIMNSANALAQATPSIRAFTEGTSAAHRMFEVIDRVPPIDTDDMSGGTLEKMQGRILLKNVNFCYPSRPDVPVLKNFNLRIAAGMNMALVGSSGSGKSTVIALLERFYDPNEGEVLIDDINIRELQLKSLRRQIGLVSQEPALFATSIKENILYGKEDASMEEVVEAAKAANAHGFISECPEGYDTQVGERGVQMSGGQKQRIAIARAILKNPRILLLDEATSALDAQSEKVVQEALDKAAKGRTTVTVAHRLSTIRSAGAIAVMGAGVLVEMGDHEELMAKGGVYSSLVSLQQAQPANTFDTFEPATRALPEKLKKRSHSRSLSLGSSRGSGRNSSFRTSSLSRSVRMLSLSGSLRRALGEAVAEKGDDFDTIVNRDANAKSTIDRPREEQKLQDVTMSRLLALNAPEWKQAVIGVLGAVGFGFVTPIFAFLLGELLEALYTSSTSFQRHKVNIVGGVLISMTFWFLATSLVQHYYFAVMGEKLTARVREMMLSKILGFEVGWFDRDENSSGALCARLGSDAAMVRILVGDCLGVVVSTITSLGVAFTIGLVLSWRIAVVLIALQPLIIACYGTNRMFLGRFAQMSAKGQLEASQVASEAVAQVRTITAFSSQDRVLNLFLSKMKEPQLKTARRSHIAGAVIGLIFFMTYSSWALMAWYGVRVVKQGSGSFGDFFKTFFVLTTTSRVAGERIAVLSPDLARAAQAVNSVFHILDRETGIEPDDEQAEKPVRIDGNVELQKVTFAYPQRPHVIVFKSFQLSIQAGRTVALVGQSGSGKSTIIGLIERFYDPLHGKVLIDGKDIQTYNLRALRGHIGLVGQEPTLFATSIRMNIAYGKQNCTEAEIIEAAKAANAHNFISALPKGYDTFAGARGLELSGGQKQRIAIARAVLKNPSILLLDEATSALDAESEAVVQSALDKMMVGRTTVVVAHRLSTIRHANTIAVLQEGSIVEQGSHNELLEKGEGGAYFSLVHMQTKA